MQVRSLRIDSYLAPGEHFHVARKALDARRPRFLHRHDFHEMFLVEKGTVRHRVDDHQETLEQGSIVFIRPEDAHSLWAAKGKSCWITNVMFRSQTADHLRARYGEEIGARFFWREDRSPDRYLLSGPRIERAANALLELRAARRTLTRIEQFLLYVMTRIVDHTVMVPSDMPSWLASACQAARSPEVFRGGAPALVAATGRSHEHVCRTIRRHLGLSPSAYVNRIRMEFAAMHLGSSETSIADIAADCGTANVSHFYKLFQAHYGSTPKQYRMRHRKNPVH
ncbi:AraC family transcriptional regulator [Jannaschia sp. S6380]|uniref:helix-turn-helix transcriptional regulator n=1 Tax=Jannaschia sp. S6380 TaxID=2926408 RepID=UPI001FF409E7|nr:AraC family transcriptional regulator [Jannaschia sp. S6380]MCK0166720.1 AraC family transcriptional regulator [Jannaschia sp. S6380]